MADPRRLREILGFGYGAPSPAMSALEPFHAGVDPAYMPQDVVTESPWEGPRGWVRGGLESLFGAMAPNERVASQAAEKVTNLSDFVNVPQEAFDIGKGIGDAVQGGDKLSLAMSMIPGKAADDLVPAVKAAQKGIRAYHGTPHDFDKFSLDKIGTGEGAQAYGHGLYFAENEGVARDYRNTLAPGATYDGLPAINAGWADTTSDRMALKHVADQMGPDVNPEDAIQAAAARFDEAAASARAAGQGDGPAAKMNAQRASQYEEIAKSIKGLDPAKLAYNQGHMYEVNINADPDAFLDWDKPLSEQSETVKRAAGSIGMEDVPRTPWTVKETSPGKFTVYNVWGERHGTFADKAKAEELAKRRTIEHHGHGNEFHPISQSSAFGRGKPEVANKLREQGVAGIKYLDAGSRTLIQSDDLSRQAADLDRQIANAQKQIADMPESFRGDYQAHIDQLTQERRAVQRKLEPSRNYVVFSDEIIDIVRKYGIAGALGAGLITQQMADQLQAQQGGGQS